MDHVIPAFKMEACNPIDTSVVFSLLLSCKKKFLFWKMFQHFMFVGLARHYFFFFFLFPSMIFMICHWKFQDHLWTVMPWLFTILKHKTQADLANCLKKKKVITIIEWCLKDTFSCPTSTQAESPRAGCLGLHPGGFWMSQRRTFHSL